MSSVVKKLIIVLFAAYVIELLCEQWLRIPYSTTLAMYPGLLAPWQLVTYTLVNGGVVTGSEPIMFLLGLLFLWWALAPFEIGYGSKRTLQLIFVSILAASVPAY